MSLLQLHCTWRASHEGPSRTRMTGRVVMTSNSTSRVLFHRPIFRKAHVHCIQNTYFLTGILALKIKNVLVQRSPFWWQAEYWTVHMVLVTLSRFYQDCMVLSISWQMQVPHSTTVKPVLRDHWDERPPVLKDHTLIFSRRTYISI